MPRVAEPPAGAPWDLPIDEAPLAFIDLEMTGLSVQTDRVVEICVERVVDGDVRGRFSSLLNPGVSPGTSTRFHGIEAEDLVDAPPFEAVAEEVMALVQGACLVAHGAKWDVSFLSRELARINRAWSCEHYLDTLALSRRMLDAPRHGLSSLAEHFGIDNPRSHRADNDVTVTRALFDHLRRTFGEVWASPNEPALRDLWRWSVGRRPLSAELLADVARAVETDARAEVQYRSANRKAPQRFTFRATRLRSDLDPPVVLGYLQRTRGRRELRLDRILQFRLLGRDEVSQDD